MAAGKPFLCWPRDFAGPGQGVEAGGIAEQGRGRAFLGAEGPGKEG